MALALESLLAVPSALASELALGWAMAVVLAGPLVLELALKLAPMLVHLLVKEYCMEELAWVEVLVGLWGWVWGSASALGLVLVWASV